MAFLGLLPRRGSNPTRSQDGQRPASVRVFGGMPSRSLSILSRSDLLLGESVKKSLRFTLQACIPCDMTTHIVVNITKFVLLKEEKFLQLCAMSLGRSAECEPGQVSPHPSGLPAMELCVGPHPGSLLPPRSLSHNLRCRCLPQVLRDTRRESLFLLHSPLLGDGIGSRAVLLHVDWHLPLLHPQLRARLQADSRHLRPLSSPHRPLNVCCLRSHPHQDEPSSQSVQTGECSPSSLHHSEGAGEPCQEWTSSSVLPSNAPIPLAELLISRICNSGGRGRRSCLILLRRLLLFGQEGQVSGTSRLCLPS